MTGLSKITDKILAEARAYADEKLASADERCAEIEAEYAEKENKLRQQISEDARREAADIVQKAKSGEAMMRRNTVLEAKGALVDEAFDIAKKQLLELPDERYLELLVMLLTATVKEQAEAEAASLELYGEDDAPKAERYEVILNARDKARCGEKLIEQTVERIGTTHADIVSRMVLAENTANIDGGLIMRFGDMEINCSVKTLFEQIRPELEAQVSRKLFPEKKGN